MSDKLNEILQDTWPNLYRPPHDFKPPSMYTVQTWDDTLKQVNYRTVVDAIDYEDAADVIKHMYPNERVLAVTKTNA